MKKPATLAQAHFEAIDDHLNRELKQARFSIRVAMAWLTHPQLVGALGDAADRGVAVEVVISRSDTNFARAGRIRQFEYLVDSGVVLLVNGPSDGRDANFLHHKFCVIDYETVITGSFNWTNNALSNEENILITRADQRLANQYLQTFEKLLARSSFLPQVLNERRGGLADEEDGFAEIFLWASASVATPGTPITLHWKSAGVTDLALPEFSTASTSNPLPEQGKLAINFPSAEQTITLTGFSEDFGPLSRSIRLRPAYLPTISLFDLSHPLTVGGAIPVRLRWETQQADQVLISPSVSLEELPLTGEVMVSPTESTTYTLTALGLGGQRQQSVSLLVAPVPRIQQMTVPVPASLRIQVELQYSRTPVPSGLDLLSSRMPSFQLASLTTLRSELVPRQPRLSKLAVSLGVGSPANLKLPPRPPALTNSWRRFQANLLNRLEQSFAHDWRLTHLLSTFRNLYGK